MIRAAVIGLTEAGREHASAYASDPDAELVAVCDRDKARADEVGARLGVPSYSDVEDLLASAGPGLCSVRSALSDRTRDIETVLASGAHVLASLPFATKASTTAELAAAAREQKRVLAADFHLRFTPAFEKALQWIADGEIGTPLFLNMNLWTRGDERDDPCELFRNLGAHAADMMRTLCGDVDRVQCFGTKAPGRPSWSSAQVNARFTGGTVGHLAVSYDMVPHHPLARIELAGSRARLVIENVYEEATLFVHREEEKRVITNSIFGGVPQLKATHARRIRRLLEQIAGGVEPERIDGGAADACAAARMMEAAILALETESVVAVNDFGPAAAGGAR